MIRPADPIVISLSSTNNSPPKLTWPPQKLDTYKRVPGHESDGDLSWCKYVCGFLKPGITNQDYSSWWNGIKRKMEQARIPSWRQSTDAQWAAIHAHSLTLAPVATPGGGRAALWQNHTV